MTDERFVLETEIYAEDWIKDVQDELVDEGYINSSDDLQGVVASAEKGDGCQLVVTPIYE